MKTHYDRFEVGAGAAGLAAAVLLWLLGTATAEYALPLAALLRWAGVALLAQGFVRDVTILLRRRRERLAMGASGAAPALPRQGWWICFESTLGLLLIGQGLLLLVLGAGTAAALALPVPAWIALFSAWWLFGYATREAVFELRRDPDHLNLWVGPARHRVQPPAVLPYAGLAPSSDGPANG